MRGGDTVTVYTETKDAFNEAMFEQRSEGS